MGLNQGEVEHFLLGDEGVRECISRCNLFEKIMILKRMGVQIG